MTVGAIGTLGSIVLFLLQPSMPTPDKLFIFAIFVGMLLRQAKQVIIRLGPFVALLLAYESFRGLAPGLNQRVNYLWMPGVDRSLFGELPTKTLQNFWWQGQASWYDFALYLPYLLHFALPFVLAIIIWKTKESEYWRYVTAFVGISFTAFFVYVLFPAAPPWMSSDMGLIEPVQRISSSVWFALGVNDFPSIYSKVSPNPVAAVPSLHAAYATLFAIFVIKFWISRWRWLVLSYPLAIYIGTVYHGEHYVIDAVLGIILAIGGYLASPYVVQKLASLFYKSKALAFRISIFRRAAD